jgi:outer membrane protein assembly factor BamD (BamD/ComL family)
MTISTPSLRLLVCIVLFCGVGTSCVHTPVTKPLNDTEETIEKMWSQANTLWNQGKKDKAEILYKTIFTRYPECCWGFGAGLRCAEYLIIKKDYTHAESLLAQLSMDYPDGVPLWLLHDMWITLLMEVKDYRRARQQCEKMITEYPETAELSRARRLLTTLDAMDDKNHAK